MCGGNGGGNVSDKQSGVCGSAARSRISCKMARTSFVVKAGAEAGASDVDGDADDDIMARFHSTRFVVV